MSTVAHVRPRWENSRLFFRSSHYICFSFVGVIATILSLLEFVTLGLKRAKIAFMCCSNEESPVARRQRLALLQTNREELHGHSGGHIKRMTSEVSLDSESSDTTIESVWFHFHSLKTIHILLVLPSLGYVRRTPTQVHCRARQHKFINFTLVSVEA